MNSAPDYLEFKMPDSTSPIRNLRCELRENPLGLTEKHPRFSWETDLRQSAYKVDCISNGRPLWSSGWIESLVRSGVVYAGPPLAARQACSWTVNLRDHNGVEHSSATNTFEKGLITKEDWSAKFIQAPTIGGPRTSPPVAYLRKEFVVEKTIKSARLYTTALGIYTANLNGTKVGDEELAPGWTEYRKRVRYQTFDVKKMLKQGENCFSALLADGWFAGHVEWRDREMYGEKAAYLGQLEIEFEDGTRQTIVTDESWKAGTGKILSADLMMGEAHDNRKEPHGYDLAGFDDSAWLPATVFDYDTELEGESCPPVKVIQEIKPISKRNNHNWNMNRWIFDMGQNMVGRIRFKARGTKGKTLTFRYAERLDKNNQLYMDNYRGAKSTDYFTFSGDGEEVFEPTFTFHGFQYVEVFMTEHEPALEDLTGIVMHSAWEPTGEISSDNALLNQFFSNVKWGWKGNSVDVPTDCPQRDERLGWTGDAQAFVRTATFLGDVQTFFEKYQQDLTDSQNEKGEIPPTAPTTGIVSGDGGAGWADAVVICPWAVYKAYGDKRILERHYGSMVKWLESLELSSKKHIRAYNGYEGFSGFGDWLSTNAHTPYDLIGTAFYSYSAKLLSKIAGVLGETSDVDRFTELSSRVANAFRDQFVSHNGYVASGTQTSNVLALHFDLLLPDQRQMAIENLVADIKKRKTRLSTGFLGSPYLLHVLSDNGHLDLAYDLLLQTQWPSWLYSVTQGATTIWERWDGWTEEKGFQDPSMNSFNHYAYGSVLDWVVAVVAGIDQTEDSAGFSQPLLAPRPGGGINQMSASLKTRYGKLSSSWKRDGDELLWDVQVPLGLSEKLVAPSGITKVTVNGVQKPI